MAIRTLTEMPMPMPMFGALIFQETTSRCYFNLTKYDNEGRSLINVSQIVTCWAVYTLRGHFNSNTNERRAKLELRLTCNYCNWSRKQYKWFQLICHVVHFYRLYWIYYPFQFRCHFFPKTVSNILKWKAVVFRNTLKKAVHLRNKSSCNLLLATYV